MHLLIVEDDPVQASATTKVLTRLGYDVSTVGDAEKAIRVLKSLTVDLVLLDWQLPKISGFELLHWIRAQIGPDLPVIFVTSRVLEVDIVLALEAGADDYVVKPFSFVELTARINARLRRTRRHAEAAHQIRVGEYVLDLELRKLTLRGKQIDLTAKEFDLTALFFENMGKIMSRDLMSMAVWGRALDDDSRSLDTHIYRIRQKLVLSPMNGLRLTSIYTHGYRLDEVRREVDNEQQYKLKTAT
ncbi:response regulator transcription factor [Paraburkholderia sediminicola]|uniref:response regulator transcription factor n=1 Tax=Paraburkholderia sediminicola TaxID=458836 RepID=UPI0038B85300